MRTDIKLNSEEKTAESFCGLYDWCSNKKQENLREQSVMDGPGVSLACEVAGVSAPGLWLDGTTQQTGSYQTLAERQRTRRQLSGCPFALNENC